MSLVTKFKTDYLNNEMCCVNITRTKSGIHERSNYCAWNEQQKQQYQKIP